MTLNLRPLDIWSLFSLLTFRDPSSFLVHIQGAQLADLLPIFSVLWVPWLGVWLLTLSALWPLGWNELLIASFSHRSIDVRDGILLATGLHVHRNSAHSAGVGAIFDRSVALGQAGQLLEGVGL